MSGGYSARLIILRMIMNVSKISRDMIWSYFTPLSSFWSRPENSWSIMLIRYMKLKITFFQTTKKWIKFQSSPRYKIDKKNKTMTFYFAVDILTLENSSIALIGKSVQECVSLRIFVYIPVKVSPIPSFLLKLSLLFLSSKHICRNVCFNEVF